MIKSTFALPEGYSLRRKVDLEKDKKLFWLVNGLALAITAALVGLGIAVGPSFVAWEDAFPLWGWLALAASMVLYIVAHEAVHGVFIRMYSGKWGNFGFKGAYAYAGSTAYFAKMPYAVIALSPVVLWGAVFAIACAVSEALFWPAYILQIVNLSGAAGDFYVSWLLGKMPEDVLIHDDGTSMAFYTREK